MNRREWLALLGAGALAVHGHTIAQQPNAIRRIGYLSLNPGDDESSLAFREQLQLLGYVDGRNVVIENRWADGHEDRVPGLAADLARLKVDAIVTRSTFIASAAKRATSTIPIVMANAADPVGGGVIASLARPGGNVTGISQNSNEIAGKRLQLLREIVPKTTRLATLVWDKSPLKSQFIEQLRLASRRMGIVLLVQEVGTTEGLAGAFAGMQRERAQGVIVQTTPFANINRQRIADLALQHRLPTIFEGRPPVADGGLMSYGASLTAMHRRAAVYVDKILKGAKPSDLPVELPTKFEMFINLKTAKALGISIPQTLLLQADEVIK